MECNRDARGDLCFSRVSGGAITRPRPSLPALLVPSVVAVAEASLPRRQRLPLSHLSWRLPPLRRGPFSRRRRCSPRRSSPSSLPPLPTSIRYVVPSSPNPFQIITYRHPWAFLGFKAEENLPACVSRVLDPVSWSLLVIKFLWKLLTGSYLSHLCICRQAHVVLS